MLAQVIGQLRPGGLGHGDEIFYAHGVFYLASDASGNECNPQSLAGRIDGGRRSGRASTEHNHVELALHHLPALVQLASKPVFQLLQEHAEVAPADVQLLAVGVDRRHGLDVKAAHFFLEECPIHHLTAHPRVENGHEIEGLHHVGAVGTGERNVGLQPDVALERAYAPANGIVGKILSLAVGIDNGHDERGELVAVGYSAELHARLLAVLEQLKLQTACPGSVERSRQMLGSRTEIVDKIPHLCRMLMGLVGRHTQLKAIFEHAENASQLFYNVCV